MVATLLQRTRSFESAVSKNYAKRKEMAQSNQRFDNHEDEI